jgi:hypothetical protein
VTSAARALVLLLSAVGMAGGAGQAGAGQLPQAVHGLDPFVAPLPRTEILPAATVDSYPFNAAAASEVPLDLGRHGYVEEEYLIEGRANVYDQDGEGALSVLANGPYTTRILVRRPASPRRFNGDVVLEPLNPSVMADAPLMWNFSHRHFMREGYAWVGLTFKPVAVRALQRFDPQRYARLDLPNPRPLESRCPDRELGPADVSQEAGLAYDIIAQAGALLRSRDPANPLRGYRVARLYLTGHSQTGGYTRKYAHLFSALIQRAGGQPIFDGYVSSGNGPFNPPINGCARPPIEGDPEMIAAAAGVPLIEIGGERDTLVNAFQRRPDSDAAPDLYRRYEVAGASHITRILLELAPRHADFAKAGGTAISLAGCDPESPPVSDFPLHYVMDATWQNLDGWVKRGIPPPRAEPLRLETAGGVLQAKKDSYGNAVGGVRTTALDVPVARWSPSRAGSYRCTTIGYAEPFDAARFRSLYPQRQDYLDAAAKSLRSLKKQRWLTAADAAEALRDANAFAPPH